MEKSKKLKKKKTNQRFFTEFIIVLCTVTFYKKRGMPWLIDLTFNFLSKMVHNPAKDRNFDAFFFFKKKEFEWP